MRAKRILSNTAGRSCVDSRRTFLYGRRRCFARCSRSAFQGRSAILFTAASEQDHIETFTSGADQLRLRQTLSERAGQIFSRVAEASGVKRVVVAGGDTSSHSGRQLGIAALTFIAHLAPGAPLCRAWSYRGNRNSLEIVFKGGQCGSENFFEVVLNGSD